LFVAGMSRTSKLTPVTSIHRFLSVGGRQVVRIIRYRTDFSYGGKTDFPDNSASWAVTNRESLDHFFEYGSFECAMKAVAGTRQLIAAATASPLEFAIMVASAFTLGRVIAVASLGRLCMGDDFEKPQRFVKMGVTGERLRFFTWKSGDPFDKEPEATGVYRNVFSLSGLSVQVHRIEKRSPEKRTPDHQP
jgi:hypothetical protein